MFYWVTVNTKSWAIVTVYHLTLKKKNRGQLSKSNEGKVSSIKGKSVIAKLT